MVGEKFDSVEKLVVGRIQEFQDTTSFDPTLSASGALFVSGGALVYKGSSGTTTVLGVA